MPEPGWLSVLPPLLAVVLAIWTRRVAGSLLAGIFLGWLILQDGRPWAALLETIRRLALVLAAWDNLAVVVFCGLVGAVIALAQRSGGVAGFVALAARRGWLGRRRGAQWGAMALGGMIFVETSISSLIVGAVFRPVFDRLKISREKLAYIADSTCAPVNLLVPLNAWGAFIIGLLAQAGIQRPVAVLLAAWPLQFYALLALLLVGVLLATGREYGPMRRAERRARDEGEILPDGARPMMAADVAGLEARADLAPRARYLLAPVAVMMGLVPLALLATGRGDLTAGSGATAVFAAVTGALLTAVVQNARRLGGREVAQVIWFGFRGMAPVMLLMALAFGLGDVARALHTGEYVAGLAGAVAAPAFIPALFFITSCVIAFATGTSWGTFAVMVPIAVPTAAAVGLPVPLLVAAALGGGLFGDHCSPVSDTTIIASLAAACDHIDHVRTQLPYALTAATAATLLYLAAGWLFA